MIFCPQAKLLWHGDRMLTLMKTGRMDPVVFEVAPTAYCNSDCPWCFFRKGRSGTHINPGVMLRVIEDMSKLRVKAINWTGGGEPTLHPNFGQFVDAAYECGMQQGLFTNGRQEIPMAGSFSWIRISLTPEGFDVIRNPGVPFGICVNHTQEHTAKTLKKICSQARDFGASYFQIRPALEHNYQEQPALKAPEYLEEFAGYDFKVHIARYKYEDAIRCRGYAICYGYHVCPSIDWLGILRPCLYVSPAKDLGDLNRESLVDAWRDIPRRIMVDDGCQNCCKNHEINKIISSGMNARNVEFV